MKALADGFWKLTLLVAALSLAAIWYVQGNLVPGGVETTIRVFAAWLGCFGVPLLLTFAYLSWVRVSRPALPVWRSGLGLASMTVLSGDWLIRTGMWVLLPTHPRSLVFDSLEGPAVLTAALLAFALSGRARIQALAGALCMMAALQAEGYF